MGSAAKYDWVLPGHRIWLAVNSDGVVVDAALFEYQRPTLLDRLRDWLGL